MQCPECGSSDDIIPWGEGYQCLDCGCEFGRNPYVTDEDMGMEEDGERSSEDE